MLLVSELGEVSCLSMHLLLRWGDKGYFYMPYEYMCHPALASDFWTINWVEGFKNTSSLSEGKLTIGGAPRHPNVVSLNMRTNMKFGWRPDMPDHRDQTVTFNKVEAPSHIKKKVEGTFVCQSFAVMLSSFHDSARVFPHKKALAHRCGTIEYCK